VSLTRFLDDKPILVLSDNTGLVEYVDYLPVVEDTGGTQKRFEDDGVYVPSSVLSDGTGLVAWVDYTPVFVKVATIRWSSDAAGFQPVNNATP